MKKIYTCYTDSKDSKQNNVLAKFKEEKRMDYRTKAINCVKDTALPVQMQWFQECDYNLDTYCRKYGETEFFFAKEIEAGHIYEMGYPKCVCPEGNDICFGKYDAGKTNRSGNNRNRFKRR